VKTAAKFVTDTDTATVATGNLQLATTHKLHEHRYGLVFLAKRK